MKRLLRAAKAVAVAASAALSFSAFTGAPAMAQEPTTIANTFNEVTLGAALDDLGMQWEVVSRYDDGAVKIRAQSASPQLVFYIVGFACPPQLQGRCVGANIYAKYPPTSPDIVNAFDASLPFVSTYIGAPERDGSWTDGEVYIARYMIADFGIPHGNIISNISNFVLVADDFKSNGLTISTGPLFKGENAHSAAEALNSLEIAKVSARKGEARFTPAAIASGEAVSKEFHKGLPEGFRDVAEDEVN